MSQKIDPKDTSISTLIYETITRVPGLFRSLYFVTLTDSERGKLSGVFFTNVEGFVDAVCDDLDYRPDLYPDLVGEYDTTEMRERMRRAWGWRLLHNVFAGFANACQDNHLYEKGTAVRMATEVANRVIAGVEHPYLNPALQHRQRALNLYTALRLLSDARQKKVSKKPKAKPAPAKPTPRQAKARKKVKAERRAAMFQLFREVLAGK